MKIYVGNLSFNTNENTVRSQFQGFGEVSEVAVVTDRETGRSRGFAFVTMNNDEQARKAIDQLNGAEMDGRKIVVNEAKPRTGAGGGGGGGGGRGPGGGGRGGPRRNSW